MTSPELFMQAISPSTNVILSQVVPPPTLSSDPLVNRYIRGVSSNQ